MSGFGAPLRTATPMPERASGVRVALSSLACAISASMAGRGENGRVEDLALLDLSPQRGRCAPDDHQLMPARLLELGSDFLQHRLQRVRAQYFDLCAFGSTAKSQQHGSRRSRHGSRHCVPPDVTTCLEMFALAS